MAKLTFSIGGIHPADKKLAKKLREYTETYRRLNDFEK